MPNNLPLISTPTHECIMPSDGAVIEYRPFLVKEEKVLLMAVESKDENEMIKTFALPNDILLEAKEYVGPIVLLRGNSMDKQGN